VVGAKRVFDLIEEHDVVIWSSTYRSMRFMATKILLFRRMELDNIYLA
jgi:hypothetical protein